MKKMDGFTEMSIESKKMGMSYGQYATYLACHSDENVRKKSPYATIEARRARTAMVGAD